MFMMWAAAQVKQPMLQAEGYEVISSRQGQTSVEFVRTYDPQVHEIVDAITAAVTGAQAGLNWLHADPPHLAEVRQALSGIVSDGKRAAELVIRLRALTKKALTVDGTPAS